MMWLQVTSLAEVWIEIALFNVSLFIFLVTSLAEVWIEIRRNWHSGWKKEVTSLAEVWIEILNKNVTAPIAAGHFPCGSVD